MPRHRAFVFVPIRRALPRVVGETGSSRAWPQHVLDRITGSDPGSNRLRAALSGAVAIASALAVEYGVSQATHATEQRRLIALLLGAMAALMGSMALHGTGVWPKVRTAAFFPVALGIGLLAGVAVGSNTDLMLGVFVLVMFVAVYVRRFGIDYFSYGFMMWMGYFFAVFLHATPAMLPFLVETVVIASAWILLLSITVLRGNPRRALARTLRAFAARAGHVARASAALLEASVTDPSTVSRWRRRLAARQAQLAEAALMIEAWSAEAGALPAGWSAAALRRQVVDAHLAADGLAAAAGDLAGSDDTALIVEAARVAGLLAARDYAQADIAAGVLLRGTAPSTSAGIGGWLSARQLAAAAIQFVASARTVGDPAEADAADEFEPAVMLAMGNLPGSPAHAREVAPRGRRWNPLTRLDFISRQAVQAAVAGGLAILAGRELSTTRYYWAVIAAFIAFTGTATRSETFIKASNRVVGTLVGLFAGLALAHLTAGHTTWIIVVIVASMACGLYLVRISYRYLILFVTIMLAQLYSELHELSDGLLMLRLEETAIGAAIGVVVALVLAPLSTRDVATTVRRNLIRELAALLHAAADHLGADRRRPTDPGDHLPVEDAPRHDLDALARGVDTRLYQLLLAAAPLTRPLVWGNSPRWTRHRLTLHSAAAHNARAVAVAARHPTLSPRAADAGRALADAATAMADDQLTAQQRRTAVLDHLAAADEALFTTSAPDDPAIAEPVGRALIQLRRLLSELATEASPGRHRTAAHGPYRESEAEPLSEPSAP